MRYYLTNDLIKVEFDSFGAEVKSVIRKDNNREYMWYADPKVWGRTSPVLFPFVGGLKNKRYTHEGKTYEMTSHGFARDNEFKCIAQSDTNIVFEFCDNEETIKKYPFHFCLQIEYVLTDDTVKVIWRVKNTGEKIMYFSIGAHPAFLCPAFGEKNKAGYYMNFGDVKEIHHYGNPGNGLCVKEDLVLPLEDGRAVITEDFFDHSTYMIPDRQVNTISIEDKEKHKIVEVNFDTEIVAVWSPPEKNAPFICIEPWYGRADTVDFEGELKDREYENELKAEELFEKAYTMKFFEV